MATEIDGYLVFPDPISEQGQWRLHALITREVNGEKRSHRLIRADLLSSRELAIEMALLKAKQVIAEQGEGMFLS